MPEGEGVSSFETFIAELRRRKVMRVAGAYTVVAWLALQVADVLMEPLQLPLWSMNLVLFLFAVGFPIVLVISWAFDATPSGLQRTAALSKEEVGALGPTRYVDFIIIAALSLVVGYLYVERFVEDDESVVAEAETDIIDASSTKPAAPDRIDATPSIAVLPFENLSASEENAFFAAGVHDDILSHISKVKGLKVISHTSVMRFEDSDKSLPEVAAELDVKHVLEGRVRRAGNKVRITVRLVEAANDQPLWAETYDRDLADIFAVQSEVAEKITDELRVALDVETLTRIKAGPTKNLEAYDLYLRGRRLAQTQSLANLNRAMELLQKAVVLDPDFALAYAAIAGTYVSLAGGFEPWHSVRKEAVAAADQAYALDKGASEVLLIQGIIKQVDRDFTSLSFLDRALEADPNNINALNYKARVLNGLGKSAQSLKLVERALVLNPLDPGANMLMAFTLQLAGDASQAVQYVERALELTPTAALGCRIALVSG